jgi:hypothetical protein
VSVPWQMMKPTLQPNWNVCEMFSLSCSYAKCVKFGGCIGFGPVHNSTGGQRNERWSGMKWNGLCATSFIKVISGSPVQKQVSHMVGNPSLVLLHMPGGKQSRGDNWPSLRIVHSEVASVIINLRFNYVHRVLSHNFHGLKLIDLYHVPPSYL